MKYAQKQFLFIIYMYIRKMACDEEMKKDNS